MGSPRKILSSDIWFIINSSFLQKNMQSLNFEICRFSWRNDQFQFLKIGSISLMVHLPMKPENFLIIKITKFLH